MKATLRAKSEAPVDYTTAPPIIRRKLAVGYIRLVDAAPLFVARELGLFAKYDLHVNLAREAGWASIRDRLAYGELHAAHALGPMAASINLGLNGPQRPVTTGLILNLHGNAITLSRELWRRGVTTATELAQEVTGTRSIKRHVFGVVSKFSTHYLLLREWLSQGGLNPDKDVDIVVLPPEQMFKMLLSRHLDGYCVGEPWNSIAIQRGAGWCPAVSADLSPGHPEKVLLTTAEFASNQPEENIALTAALLEACRWCQHPDNRTDLSRILSTPECLDCEEKIIAPTLDGQFPMGDGTTRDGDDFIIFAGEDGNRPTIEKALWLLEHMDTAGQLDGYHHPHETLARQIFRPEIYDAAKALIC